MTNEAIATKRPIDEGAVTERFLDAPGEESFAELFKTFPRNWLRSLGRVVAQW